MAESPHKRKMMVAQINLEELKKEGSVFSTPSSPTLQKASSLKHSCLCSPTTHAGSFRCRYHRTSSTPILTPGSLSVGSKLSELASVGSKLAELQSKPP